jgi:hypothetical protein
MVLSFHAGYGTDPEHSGITRPRASDRGRLYLGPLHTGVIGSVALPNGTQIATIQTPVITVVLNAFSTLFSNLAGHNWSLSVHSRKEQLLKAVQYKAMDNSFDTMGRREVEPPGLQTWLFI